MMVNGWITVRQHKLLSDLCNVCRRHWNSEPTTYVHSLNYFLINTIYFCLDYGMAGQQSYWVVFIGHRPVIYNTWEESEVQVNGYSGELEENVQHTRRNGNSLAKFSFIVILFLGFLCCILVALFLDSEWSCTFQHFVNRTVYWNANFITKSNINCQINYKALLAIHYKAQKMHHKNDKKHRLGNYAKFFRHHGTSIFILPTVLRCKTIVSSIIIGKSFPIPIRKLGPTLQN